MASLSLIPFILISSCQLIFTTLANSHKNPKGLTLELIPQKSPNSFINTTHAKLTSSNPNGSSYPSLQPNMITPHVIPQIIPNAIMAVKINIGTFNNKSPASYYLLMDTGSNLVWTQCEDCKIQGNNCYKQKEEPFPNKQSKSYKALPCNHPLCNKGDCNSMGQCTYSLTYLDKASSSGILSTETFTFPSSSSSQGEALQGIVFGCGHKNNDPTSAKDPQNYQIAGTFGLGQGKRSFVQQFVERSGVTTFSYCMLRYNDVPNPPTTYLRFGSDIKPPKNLQTVGFYKVGESGAYYVGLEDLGVEGERLRISPTLFSGGIIIDSGSSVSKIVKGAYYNGLVKGIDKHFSKIEEFKKVTYVWGYCYGRDRQLGYTPNIPRVQFYFKGGGVLEVGAENVFRRRVLENNKEEFCLFLYPDENVNILGAAQQANHKFIFDVKANKIQFGPEDCALNS